MEYVREGGRPHFVPKNDEWWEGLMCRCWNGNEQERPSFEAIVDDLERRSGERIVEDEEDAGDAMMSTLHSPLLSSRHS